MPPSGFLNIHKPRGITSFDVIHRLRKITGEKQIGHAGTLDPLASGVLLVAVGKTVRLLEYLLKQDKTYETIIELGKRSDTFDQEGKITIIPVPEEPDPEKVQKLLQQFTGEIEQTPPAFSALKVNGKKAYDLARQGAAFELPKRTVTIHSLKLLEYHHPFVKIQVHCSSGTYIRSLANDLGQLLQTGGIVSELVRTQIGKHVFLQDAVDLEKVSPKNVDSYFLSLEKVVQLLDLPTYIIPSESFADFCLGKKIALAQNAPHKSDNLNNKPILCLHAGKVVGIATPDDTRQWLQPEKVLVSN